MSERPDPIQALWELNEYNKRNPTDIYKYRSEEGKVSELEPLLLSLECKLSAAEFKLKLAEAVTEADNREFKVLENKRKINIQELSELRREALMRNDELQEAKAEIERVQPLGRDFDASFSKRGRGTKDERVTRDSPEASRRGNRTRTGIPTSEARYRDRHRKELGRLTANLEATTTKAEQASADLQKIQQSTSKALEKLNTKLAKKTAALAEKERELSIATEALATKSSDNCSKTNKFLEIDLRDAEAINNASRTSAHAEADRIKKGIAKATIDLEARLNVSEHKNDGLERKCCMFEDRYSEQVIASAKKEEQIIRSVVEERRSHDRVLELQRDLGKEENRFFELELALQDLRHQFGVDGE
ncbi:hypothetical protein BCON_0014g00760 [Botryotinia convoluta]|uniref:Uncharacterized protein n=1 Tax=Botryotinia convoluta TaxID=54673 RepID=A0A4Z1IPD9_9HELO|nr:hypothetical protein BCON_0014g00760 [Botryotinia convoluta]